MSGWTRRPRTLAAIAAGSLLLSGMVTGAGPAKAVSSAHASFKVPYTISSSITPESYCDNTGPHLTFSSVLTLGDHGAQVSLTQNVNHQWVTTGALSLSLFDLDPTHTGDPYIAKQPPLGGVGGNAFMYFRDTAGVDHYLGRCVQDFGPGHDNGKGPFTNKGDADGYSDIVTKAIECSNRGTSLDLETTSGTDDFDGMLVLTNNFLALNGRTPHINDTDIAAKITLTLAKGPLVRKSPHFDGAGGNPKVTVQTGLLSKTAPFFTADSTPPAVDGVRCNKL
jgi:hypothetical protein